MSFLVFRPRVASAIITTTCRVFFIAARAVVSSVERGRRAEPRSARTRSRRIIKYHALPPRPVDAGSRKQECMKCARPRCRGLDDGTSDLGGSAIVTIEKKSVTRLREGDRSRPNEVPRKSAPFVLCGGWHGPSASSDMRRRKAARIWGGLRAWKLATIKQAWWPKAAIIDEEAHMAFPLGIDMTTLIMLNHIRRPASRWRISSRRSRSWPRSRSPRATSSASAKLSRACAGARAQRLRQFRRADSGDHTGGAHHLFQSTQSVIASGELDPLSTRPRATRSTMKRSSPS